jgi:uncharacterized membrane protein
MNAEKGSGLKYAYLIVAANLLLSVLTYPMLPDRIIIHWGAGGTPDGYGAKLTGVLLMQLVQFVILGLFYVIPRINPQRKIKTSTKYFSSIMNLMLIYFLFFNGIFIAQNLGFSFNMNSILIPAVGVLLFFLGSFISKVELNWFVGVRTPWTLSNEEVWRSTHEKAGVLFKINGMITVLGLLVPKYSIWLLLLSVFSTTLYLVVFSYTEYRRLEAQRSAPVIQ